MWEQLALTIIFGIIGKASGITAEVGVGRLRDFFREKKGNKAYINHDLKRGLNHAYLLALMNICNECLESLKGTNGESETHIQWLEDRQRQLSDDLSLCEKGAITGDLEFSVKELETLLISNQLSDSEFIKTIERTLVEFALIDEGAPSCYNQKVRNSLFDELSLYFAFELKNNDKMRHIFESQILSHIDIRIETLEKSIYEISKKYPELQTKLDSIQNEIISARIHFDSHQREIIEVLTGSMNDISEIKTHLKILTQYLDENEAIFPNSSDFNAILYVKKDDVAKKKYFPLKNSQEIYLIGRDVKSSSPDISFHCAFVSKKHAKIERKESEFLLSDTMSKNGTRINGIPLEKGKEYKLKHGDQISFANDNVICYFCWHRDSDETMDLRE
jgi:hypothetical protein